MNYYIADTHFGHFNIIKHDANNGCKKFSSIEEHDNLIIENWNSVVKQTDNVYILGDFSWLYGRETKEIIEKLNGQKFLIKGNHDRWSKDGACKKLFQGIYDIKQIEDNGRQVILSHFPIMMWSGQHRGVIHLYGHVHMTDEWKLYTQSLDSVNDYFKDKEKKGYTGCPPALAFNVGCMLSYMDYTPRTLKEILENN